MALRERMEQEGDWLFRWRSYLPLLVIVAVVLVAWLDRPYDRPLSLGTQIACFFVGVLGQVVRVLVAAYVPKRTSGRNTGKGQVADSLNTTGIYSVLRHPLYLGNYLMWIGCIAVVGSGWLVVCTTLAYWLYYERIMLCEERFLLGKFEEEYKAFAAETTAFWPRVWRWTKPAMPFCWKTALKREYASFAGYVIVFCLLAQGPRLLPGIGGGFRPDWIWTSVLLAGIAAYVGVRIARKKKLLSVDGR